jgi:hypothetical protein
MMDSIERAVRGPLLACLPVSGAFAAAGYRPEERKRRRCRTRSRPTSANAAWPRRTA